jgi:hypothetical protein
MGAGGTDGVEAEEVEGKEAEARKEVNTEGEANRDADAAEELDEAEDAVVAGFGAEDLRMETFGRTGLSTGQSRESRKTHSVNSSA